MDEKDVHISTEIVEIFEFLSKNEEIIFKSQQINEPELTVDEKKCIAKEIYLKSRQTFLLRFGNFFEAKHLEDFSKVSADEFCDERFNDLSYIINDLRQKLKTRNQLVKNRRYMALKSLIEQGEYFCETEMMKRNPELYHELVGKYLSEEEKKERDSYDVKNTSFSGILLHTFENRERNDMMEATKAAMVNCDSSEDEEDHSHELPDIQSIQITENIVDDDDYFSDNTPISFKQQWGNFENEQIPCSTSKIKTTKRTNKKTKSPISKFRRDKFITSGERELLRHEFIKIMHTNFLTGVDKEFDYREVDDNPDLDDLKQFDQDKEDAYFNDLEENCQEELVEGMEGSEDELDIYMKHLNNHHSLHMMQNI